MKHHFTAIALAASLLFASQPGMAQSRPQERCTQQNAGADCSKVRPAHRQATHKITKHRSKNIDPITTCGVSKNSPCVPKRSLK